MRPSEGIGAQHRHGQQGPHLATGVPADAALVAQGIAEAARQLLRHQPHLSVQRIWCEFQEGRLYLRGQVPSFYYKQLAQVAVAKLEGVRQVVNEIEVLW